MMVEHVTDKDGAIQTITDRLASLAETVSNQGSGICRLNRVVDKKDKTIRDLKKRLTKYEEPPKDSDNSSIPPTQDTMTSQIIRHTNSLRKKSGRKTGGQPGHDDHFLKKYEDSDFIIEHYPDNVCERCSESLAHVEAEVVGTSLIIDLPLIKPVITEHVLYGKRCKCGHMNKCEDSKKYTSRVSYGKMIKAVIAYWGICSMCHSRGHVKSSMASSTLISAREQYRTYWCTWANSQRMHTLKSETGSKKQRSSVQTKPACMLAADTVGHGYSRITDSLISFKTNPEEKLPRVNISQMIYLTRH